MSKPLERRIAAEVAAPGLAMGPIYLAPAPRWQTVAKERRPAAEERTALERAMEQAGEALRVLAARSEETASEILAHQIAMLADPELVAPALEAIEGGEPAAEAFSDALEIRIADCRAAEDDRLQARAEDLADLRDRVLTLLGGATEKREPLPEGAIVIAENLTPSGFLDIDWQRARGAALSRGSANSHVASLARARRVPLLINLDCAPEELAAGTEAVLDAEKGQLILRPSRDTGQDYRARTEKLKAERRIRSKLLSGAAVTADGMPVALLLNVDDPSTLESVAPEHCDGIGLTRTEFLFSDGALPDEERQYRIYRGLLFWAGERPVTIRTLDAGADKPIRGLTPAAESNPFLGMRGIRLSLARPEVFRVQLRALARAACHGKLKVMVPMVTTPEELARARAMLAEEVAALKAAGSAAEMPAFGMMVETPAATLTAAAFDADFYSIGTNDLIQYVMAASRDSAVPKHLQDPENPAILELIERVCAAGRERGVEVSVCGEMAAMPKHVPALLRAGVKILSVPPMALAPVKAAIRALRLGNPK